MENPGSGRRSASARFPGAALRPVAGGRDWTWQLRNAVTTADGLARALSLSPEELRGARAAERAGLPISVTPYYLALCEPGNPFCPIRRQVVPTAAEWATVEGDLRDPLGEEAHEVAPHLIRRYSDRALIVATDRCAVYCRFCTRRRLVGRGGGARSLERLAPAFGYLRTHPEVRDVVVSGGDPLAQSTARLVDLLAALRRIPSIETIRLATRLPVVLPQRIDDDLVRAIQRFHPVWLMTHFNHPRELTADSQRACNLLADGGFPLMNHTVLLRGVNDDDCVLEDLFRGLVRERVRPYYLLQADPVRGTGHLRTPLRTGLEIMRRLQGRLSGIALPKLIVDTPGGMGKVPVSPDFVLERRPGVTRFSTPRGVDVDYIDPP